MKETYQKGISLLVPRQKLFAIVFFVCTLAFLFWFLFVYAPLGVDWDLTYSKLNFWKPYERFGVGYGFFNPPWTMLFLPHAWLPARVGNSLNLLLNLLIPVAVIRKLRGGYAAAGMVYFSPFFIQLIQTNNIDWIPMAAFLVPEPLGVICLSCKPYAVAGAALLWLRKSWHDGYRNLFRFLIPITVVLLASPILWPNWWSDLISIIRQSIGTNPVEWNWSIFPFAVPLGLWLLWKAWKLNDPLIAAIATPCLVPYITPYGFTATFLLIACRFRKEATLIWVCAWWVTLVGLM